MIPRRSLPLFAIGIVAAILAQLGALALVLLLILVISEAARIWVTKSLDRVEYERHFGQPRAFFGEEIDFSVQVINRKPLPLPWLEIEDEFPEALDLTSASGGPAPVGASGKPRRKLLTNLYSLAPYERVVRNYRLHCNKRGLYAFGPALLRSGDIFGFGNQERETTGANQLIVYPRILPVEQFGLPAKRPFGDIRLRDRLIEDPSRLRAIRAFEPGDPIKRVHWKATAKSGDVQVKQFDASTSLDILIVLNIATFEQAWQGVRTDLLEQAISVAASVASHALGEGVPSGLMVNAPQPGQDAYVKIPPGRGPDQLLTILEALAKLSPFVSTPLEGVLARERRALPWAATIVVVSALTNEELLTMLLALRRAGHRVVLIVVGDETPPSLSGITTYHVAEAAEAFAL